jgi:hypothetical protein
MAFTSITDALAQYNAALPWQSSQGNALLALDAVRYLLIFRAQHLSDAGMQFSYESLLAEKKALERFVGATAPRALGRSRRNTASFNVGGIG